MKKEISARQWATIKRVAQSVQPLVSKQETLQKQTQKLYNEFKELDTQIEAFDYGIKSTYGLGVRDMVKKNVIVLDDKFDKDGHPMKKTVYVPTEKVEYDKEKNVYYLDLPNPENEGTQEAPSTDTVENAQPGNTTVEEQLFS